MENYDISAMKPKENIVKALWRGHVPLWKTYWLFGVLVNSAILIIIGLIITCCSDYVLSTNIKLFWTTIIMAYAIWYPPFILIAVWRSANNYKGNKRWAGLAKIAVIFSVIRVTYDWVILFQ